MPAAIAESYRSESSTTTTTLRAPPGGAGRTSTGPAEALVGGAGCERRRKGIGPRLGEIGDGDVDEGQQVRAADEKPVAVAHAEVGEGQVEIFEAVLELLEFVVGDDEQHARWRLAE